MKLFVTGGTGFLGESVVSALVGAGHEVRMSVRRELRKPPAGVEVIKVGLDEGGRLREVLAGCDALVHMAGKVSRHARDSADMHWIHVEATQKLLDAAEAAGVRRVLLASTSGTIAVSREKRRPATEEDSADFEVIGRWPYYTSKLLQEQEVLRRDKADRIEAVIMNPSLLLGPGDERLSSTADVLNVLNRRVPALTDGTVAFVDVRDCAPAFVAALDRGRRGQRYLLNGANIGVRGFVERISLAGGVASPKFKLSNRWATTSAKVLEGVFHALDREAPVDAVSVDIATHHWGCDATRAKKELGFAPRDPQETINDTIRDLETRGLFRRG